jgi:hypothetical protein
MWPSVLSCGVESRCRKSGTWYITALQRFMLSARNKCITIELLLMVKPSNCFVSHTVAIWWRQPTGDKAAMWHLCEMICSSGNIIQQILPKMALTAISALAERRGVVLLRLVILLCSPYSLNFNGVDSARTQSEPQTFDSHNASIRI